MSVINFFAVRVDVNRQEFYVYEIASGKIAAEFRFHDDRSLYVSKWRAGIFCDAMNKIERGPDA